MKGAEEEEDSRIKLEDAQTHLLYHM